MAKHTPIDEVAKMQSLNMNDAQIIRKLTEQGFNPVEINDALNQAKIKQEIGAGKPLSSEGFSPSMMNSQTPQMDEVPVPTPSAIPPRQEPLRQERRVEQPLPPVRPEGQEQGYPYPYPTYEDQPLQQPSMGTEAMEEIAEEIVNEKWQEAKAKIGDVVEWKGYADRRINSIEERIKRLESSMDRLQTALLSKVNEYGRSIKMLGAEIGSVENTLGKVLSPLVDNVKELGKIKDELKKMKPVPKKRAKKK